MGKPYQNKLLNFLEVIKKDLQDKKINQKQFKFLLGMFISTEFSNYVNEEIKNMLPDDNEDMQKLTFISYKRNRKFSHGI